MIKKSQTPPPLRVPIPFTHGCNGEYVPPAPSQLDKWATKYYWRLAGERARKLGLTRRQFIARASGSALALWVMNMTYGCVGGLFTSDKESTIDDEKACVELSGDEFIFDIQTHHVNPDGLWRQNTPGWTWFLQSLPQSYCGEPDLVDCFSMKNYLREMFVNSETTIAVLSALPAEPYLNPLVAEEAAQTREIFDSLSDSNRLLIHGLVMPDLGITQLEGMQGLVEEQNIAAWKIYTPYGGWRLDDETVGIPFIEKARSLGVNVICAHKGFPLSGFDPAFAAPDDIGVVAAAYPDVKFIVYHSAFESDIIEGEYNPNNPQGVDRLIKTLQDNSIAPDSNVYAELGSTWRFLMTNPTQAAHVIGKLLKFVGENRVVWGTDSIWYGTPQDQITAFRAFQISAEFQETYGYPAMTSEIREKVFGLNAADAYGVDVNEIRCGITEDDIAKLQASLDGEALPTWREYGPQTQREFFAFLKGRGGMPG